MTAAVDHTMTEPTDSAVIACSIHEDIADGEILDGDVTMHGGNGSACGKARRIGIVLGQVGIAVCGISRVSHEGGVRKDKLKRCLRRIRIVRKKYK